MPNALSRWSVPVTWTPVAGTYTPVTVTVVLLAPTTATAASVQSEVTRMMALCNAQNTSSVGTATIASDQNDYDRNGVVIS